MFSVTEAEAAAIRAVFHEKGELSAAVELRRIFPGIIDNVQARLNVRIIVGWKPLPLSVATGTALKPRRPRRRQ
jgi:hypothetical protein